MLAMLGVVTPNGDAAPQCDVANPDPEHCSDANQQATSVCKANAEFQSKILDVMAASKVSWSAE